MVPKKTPSKADSAASCKAKCDYCGKKRKIFYGECDPEWELEGHPDHIFRMVCHNCVPEVDARYECAALAYEAMSFSMEKKGLSGSEIDRAIHIVWQTIHVKLDVKAFVKLARQLKVKHPWLKGKKAK